MTAIIRKKLYLKKNAQRIKQVAEAYRRRNREKIRDNRRQNREKIREWDLRYRENNGALIKARNRICQKRYKQRHKTKILAYQRIYRAKNKQKISQYRKGKRRLKKAKAASQPPFSKEESRSLFTCPFDTDSHQIERLELITSLM